MTSLCSSYAIQHAVRVVEVASWIMLAFGSFVVLLYAPRLVRKPW